MSRRVRAVVIGVLAALVLGGCSDGGTGVKKEEPARLPDVTLSALQGEDSLDLSTVRGPTVVNLWASWCTPCRRELPLYQAYSKKYAGKVQVLGIDFQETQKGKARELIRETGVTYPLFSDPDGKLRAIGLPKLILLDAQGRVAHEEYVEITSLAQLERLVDTHLEVGS
jgi:thiol-disulfide isomerase/thioredoxin